MNEYGKFRNEVPNRYRYSLFLT